MVTTCYLQMCSKFSKYSKLCKLLPTNNTFSAYIDERNYDNSLNTTFVNLCYIFFTQLITHISSIKCNKLIAWYLIAKILLEIVLDISIIRLCTFSPRRLQKRRYNILKSATFIWMLHPSRLATHLFSTWTNCVYVQY